MNRFLLGSVGLAGTVIGAAIIGIGLQSFPSGQQATAPEPAPTATQPAPSGGALAAKGPKLLVGEHTITGYVPGGGAVYTPSFTRFVLRDATGTATLTHDAIGSGVGAPAFDGTHRLAYWSRTDPAGIATYQLRVWDQDRDVDSAVSPPSSRTAYGGPIWSGSGALIYATAMPTTSTTTDLPPCFNYACRDVELHVLDPGGSDRTIARTPFGDQALVPLWASADLVGGLAAHEYRVLTVSSGQIIARFELGASPPFELSSAGEVVVAIGRPFESAPGPVRILRARDAAHVADLPPKDFVAAVARPGRTQIVIGRVGGDLELFDYTTMAARSIASRAGSVAPIAVSADGRSALIRSVGYELLDLETGLAVPMALPNAPTASVLAVIGGR